MKIPEMIEEQNTNIFLKKSRKLKTKIVSWKEMSKMIERLREFKLENKLKNKQIADTLHYSQGYISDIFNFKSEITIDVLVGLKRGYPQISCNYILFGIKNPPTPFLTLADLVNLQGSGLNPEKFVTVPLISGKIAATLGDGVIVDEQVEDWAVIHQSITGKKKKLVAIRIDKKDGDSMKPFVTPGDVVIIDREDKLEIDPKAIYAVRIKEGSTVKKIQKQEHELLLISTNQDPDYNFEIKTIDLRIDPDPVIGRVIWCSKAL